MRRPGPCGARGGGVRFRARRGELIRSSRRSTPVTHCLAAWGAAGGAESSSARGAALDVLRAFAEAKQRCVQSVRRGPANRLALRLGGSGLPANGLTEAVRCAEAAAAPIYLFAIYSQTFQLAICQVLRRSEVERAGQSETRRPPSNSLRPAVHGPIRRVRTGCLHQGDFAFVQLRPKRHKIAEKKTTT